MNQEEADQDVADEVSEEVDEMVLFYRRHRYILIHDCFPVITKQTML